jgi:hypothetical protein
MPLLEDYLNRIMEIADLAPRDARRVRNELRSHLQELLDAGNSQHLSESEVMEMVENRFGSPEELGTMIARAKGRFRTYLKKQARQLPLALAVALVLALTIRATAVTAVRVGTDALSPRVPANSRLLVNRLNKHVDVNDVVVFQPGKGYRIAIVSQVDPQRGGIIIHTNDLPDSFVPSDQIVGKAMFVYWYVP